MKSTARRIAIIGAGPIGLEAALHGALSGFQVRVFERARVAQNIKEWGHVRLFSPFGMNSSEQGRQAVAASQVESTLPDEGACVTGWDFAERYLVPLSRLPALADCVSEESEVLGIGRSRHWKRDAAGSPGRFHDPFQLLVRGPGGTEQMHRADFVFDCSGTYPNSRWMGSGGIPCPGELACAARVDYRLPDLLGKDRARFVGKKTLVVGSGHSAATAVASLVELSHDDSRTGVFWITRFDKSSPLDRIDNDPLPLRDKLAAWVNRLATERGNLYFMPGRVIRGLEFRVDRGKFLVMLDRLSSSAEGGHSGQTMEQLAVDCVIANVGYRPSRAIHEELQVDEGDGAPSVGLEAGSGDPSRIQEQTVTRRSPEPGFFILGAKSRGGDSRFLIQAGLQQIRDVFSLLPA